MIIPIERLKLIELIERSLSVKPVKSLASYKKDLTTQLKRTLSELPAANTIEDVRRACGTSIKYGEEIPMPVWNDDTTELLQGWLDKLRLSNAKTIKLESHDRKLSAILWK